MIMTPTRFRSLTRVCLAATALASVSAFAGAPDPAIAPWLGKEITITSSTLGDHVPAGAKLTFVYDGEDDVVRVCTRSVPNKRAVWKMDLAVPCAVALNVVRGERYCSDDEDDRAKLVDLLADAMHWCRLRGVDFGAVLRVARMHFQSEIAEDGTP